MLYPVELRGPKYRTLAKYRGLDTVQLTDRIIGFIDIEQPDAVVVDGDGLGAGVVDQLNHRNYGRNLHEFHGGANAADCNMYYNRHSEMWGLTRDWLKAGAEIPDDPELANDLTAPGYATAGGKRFHGSIILESKDDLKARGEASPDDGDTLAMTFAVKVAAKQKPDAESMFQGPFGVAPENRWMM
jgi:hypothetical protein